MSFPATQTLPRVTPSSLSINRMRVDLPGARRPDEKDEFPLLDVEGDVVGGDGAALVDLRYVFEPNHGDKRSVAAFIERAADLETVTTWRRLRGISVRLVEGPPPT